MPRSFDQGFFVYFFCKIICIMCRELAPLHRKPVMKQATDKKSGNNRES